MNILVADDEAVSRRLVVELLKKMGHEVEAVADGRAACARLQAPDAPQLAILDWMMPGMDGPEIIRTLRQHPDLYPYLILLTHRSETEDKVAGLGSGADDYLVKPVHYGELQARVDVGIRYLEMQKRLAEKSTSLIRLEREQKADSLAKMAGGVAHHINNKLQVVIGYLDLLHVDPNFCGRLAQEHAEMLAHIREAAKEATEIGKKMLAYLSQNQSPKEAVAVRGLLENVLEDLSHDFPLLRNAVLQGTQDLPEVYGNREELQMVFFQLLRNALEASPETVPCITLEALETSPAPPPLVDFPAVAIPLQSLQRVSGILVTIADRGPGIPAAHIGQIFDPFFSTKFTGRGLGLSVSMGIIKRLEGSVRISCPPQGGTVAEVFLPGLFPGSVREIAVQSEGGLSKLWGMPHT